MPNPRSSGPDKKDLGRYRAGKPRPLGGELHYIELEGVKEKNLMSSDPKKKEKTLELFKMAFKRSY